MFDMTKWGADWLENQVKASVNQEMTLSWGNTSVTIPGCLVDEEGRVLPGGSVKVMTEHTKFMFATEDIVGRGVPLKRGVVINYAGQSYEMVATTGTSNCWTYNDVHRKFIVVNTKHAV